MSEPTDVQRLTTRTTYTVEEYRGELLGLLAGPLPSESLPLRAASGRVLAEPAHAQVAVPSFDNSAMDGYAVRWDDVSAALPVTLEVVGDVPAGSGDDPALAPGQCVRIMTGAALPTAADTVVQVELSDGGHEQVTFTGLPDRGIGAHVRRAGEDVAVGDEVLSAGTSLDGGALSALAAVGLGEVAVRRRPTVVVAATGDELVGPGEPLARGQIHESNTVYLADALRAAGADVEVLDVVPDVESAFRGAVGQAAQRADLVVLTGGASVGAFDVSRMVLESLPQNAFRHVRMQPGKPQGWAVWDGTPVVCLPGNPLSAAVSCTLFVVPLVSALLGRPTEPSVQTAVAGASWSSPPGRRQLLPVVRTADEQGRFVVQPTHRRGSGSHLATALARADALAVVPEEVTAVTEGDVVRVVPLRP